MKFLFKLLVFLVILSLGGGFILWQQYQHFLQTPLQLTDNRIFEIKQGSNIRHVAETLESMGLLQPDWMFIAHARLTNKANKLKAGEYQLTPGMKPDDILSVFVNGQALQYQLIIPEGKTFSALRASIEAHPALEKTLSDADYANIMQKLGAPAGTHPEGWFYPDTYNFPRKTTDLAFLQRSYKAMQTYLQQAWEKREPHPHLKTPYDALILASIVEKETGLPEERPLVARVFLNRLEKGMLLQTDPSVIYGLGDKYDGNIRKIDLQTDTPYNTYTRAGLPPTPIATPSKAAIDAVLHPAQSNVLYFVATTPGGSSKFSVTLEEHNQAVQQYILNRQKQQESKP